MDQNPNPNPNPNPPQDPYTKINQCLYELRNLIGELRNTREPSCISLATSLDNIVASIGHAHGQLSDISKYRARMREYYSTNISKEEVKNLHITKEMIVQLFIDPRTNQPHDPRKMSLHGLVHIPTMERPLDG
jgi:hypothetical protein